MQGKIFQDLGNDIYCIETELLRPGLASCYLVRSGDAAAFVDTGTYNSIPNLMQTLREIGMTTEQVKYVIPTHVHLDHAGGAGELMRLCPNATLVVHQKGAPHMIDPHKLIAGATAVYGESEFAKHYGTLVSVAAERVITPADGETLDLNGRTLQCFDTPGHANHHHCIFDHTTRSFFTGDTFGISYREFDSDEGAWLFATTTPVAFDPEGWDNSLQKMMAQQPQAMYLTHYGRIDNVKRMESMLRDSLKVMVETALAEEQQADEGRQQRIYQRILDSMVKDAQAKASPLDEAKARELLAFDADLNAQGLEVWLKRRAKAAQQASA
ncbi:MAG: MBL fold metallo-hydrolase [Proteobacteria bacterium]|nr:MAG: MBL fold metallo-hydrolase [Pseudomonadota bacterium]